MKKLCAIPDSDESVFEMLAANVEALYCELSAAPGNGAEPTSGVKSDTNGNVYIEYVDCSTLPFDFRTVASIMWKLVSTTSMNLGNRQYQVRTTLAGLIFAISYRLQQLT